MLLGQLVAIEDVAMSAVPSKLSGSPQTLLKLLGDVAVGHYVKQHTIKKTKYFKNLKKSKLWIVIYIEMTSFSKSGIPPDSMEYSQTTRSKQLLLDSVNPEQDK